MSPLQIAAIISCGVLPFGLWLGSRRLRSAALQLAIRRSLAIVLLLFEAGDRVAKLIAHDPSPDAYLPMQLCDWALFAVAFALWWRSSTAFALGYFWALAGTVQALLTPAIDAEVPWWRLFGFFFSHAFIIIGVLHLLLTECMRPRARDLPAVLIWSEGFLGCALLTNWLTGANFGFLAHPPAQPSLLDLFSKTHRLYVVQINAVALTCFAILYLPWWIYDQLRTPQLAEPL